MRKKIAAVIFLIIISILPLYACDKDAGISEYEASEDFFDIAVTFAGNAASARAFNFFSVQNDAYLNNCAVQLDPSDADLPSFNSKDNILLNAESFAMGELLPQGEKYRHRAAAYGLAADTKYFYRVGSPSLNAWSAYGYFKTAGAGDIDFLYVTDPQATSPEEYAHYGNLLGKAYETFGTPDFIVSAGDQIENFFEPREWDYYFESAAPYYSKTTLAPASGNHEFLYHLMNDYFYIPRETVSFSYTFEYGDAFFAYVDTNDFSMTEQMLWLDSVLKATDKKWKIVVFHKSPFSSGVHADQSDVLLVKEKLVPVLGENGVDLALSGHDHIYSRTYPLNGSGEISYGEINRETLENGVIKSVYNSPAGTIYAEARCSGIKYYSKSYDGNDYAIEKGDPEKTERQVFAGITISGGNLTYTAYELNGEEVEILDILGIIK
jgi:Phosphodiesterase/alkaline phosphatase D